MYLSNQSKDQVLSENIVETNIKCTLKNYNLQIYNNYVNTGFAFVDVRIVWSYFQCIYFTYHALTHAHNIAYIYNDASIKHV